MYSVLSYVTSFLVFYFAGLAASWIGMGILVFLLVKQWINPFYGDVLKQFIGSFAWGLIGCWLAYMTYHAMRDAVPSIIFVLVCGAFNIAASSVGLKRHYPKAQILGAIMAVLLTVLLFKP